MTERDEYTPSVDEALEAVAVALFEKSHEPSFSDDSAGMAEALRFTAQVVGPLIEAVRQEERERCARIADRMHGVGNDIVARRIREQGR